MSIADFIVQGIGPSGDVPHFITAGLDIAEPPVLTGAIITADVEARGINRFVEGLAVARDAIAGGVNRFVEGQRKR